MKIHLGINIDVLEGYVNLDPCGGPNKTLIDPSNLDVVAETAECTEILAPDVLDYIHGSKLLSTLQNWVSKLRRGGKITIGGTDITILCKSIQFGQITVVDANKILYGNGESVWEIKQGCYSCYDISHILSENGLRVTKKRISNTRYIVEAERV